MTLCPKSTRPDDIARLVEGRLDVLIIGGGIVGSGIARDAAMRGLRVGLVDKHDFAYGTSSRSSRLLHGGLRYLAQGRVQLVREASVEKTILHRIAPHLTTPLAFVFPTYRGSGWPLWQLRIGVKFYDLLCGSRNLGPSTGLSRSTLLRELPALKTTGLTGAVRYFDALTNDARLVIDTLRSAAHHGATAVSRLAFHAAHRDGATWTCDVEDVRTARPLTVRTHALVNATGPWAGQLPGSAVRLRLTKGIHLVVDRNRLPARDAVVITEGRRLLFVIPWGTRVILGTTDTDYEGAPEEVRILPTDLAYLLHTVNEFFPVTKLTVSDVFATWAGLRPLLASPDGSPSDISRTHQITNPHPGWWDVAGGKLTTYRLMAEQTVDRVLRHLGKPFMRSRTAGEPLLPPGEHAPSGVLPPDCTRTTVEHFIRREWAVRLEDVMLRRAGWHYYLPHREKTAAEVARWMQELLGWSDEERDAELAAYRRLLEIT